MARKYGQTYSMSKKFEDYSYIINGVGGIGKTTLVYEIGKYVTGSNEGTFIITCGGENKPKHIHNAFGDHAPDFKTFKAIVQELCKNKEEYPNTKFVAIDSLDEYCRAAENFVINEWNAICDPQDRAKSISQAYKGYQKGENRVCDLIIDEVVKLQNAGYSILEIGHTKTKSKEDVVTKVQFEQLTCNLDNKYYNALKDKCNLVAMCYYEHDIENIEEKKDAFTKKMKKVGELVDRKRVMVFADDDNAIDCKTHFEYIEHKIELDAAKFVQAVENAIELKLRAVNGEDVSASTPVVEDLIEEDDITYIDDLEEEIDDTDDDVVDDDELVFNAEKIRNHIRTLHPKATKEQKAKIKELRGTTKLDDIEDPKLLLKMVDVLEE